MRFLRVFFVVSDRDVLYPRSEVISSVGKRIHVDEYRTVRFRRAGMLAVGFV